MAYIARRTRDKAAFLAPLTPCGQQKGAKRQFSPFFADFDQKTQKLHQNKPEIGIAHQFYIEKGITGVISGEVFFYRPPLLLVLPRVSVSRVDTGGSDAATRSDVVGNKWSVVCCLLVCQLRTI